jgi:hypothetical protein
VPGALEPGAVQFLSKIGTGGTGHTGTGHTGTGRIGTGRIGTGRIGTGPGRLLPAARLFLCAPALFASANLGTGLEIGGGTIFTIAELSHLNSRCEKDL